MRSVTFQLAISTEELMRLYRGDAHWVRVRDTDGSHVQFPATWLRPFVGADGVRGTFVLTFDDQHRRQDFRKIG